MPSIFWITTLIDVLVRSSLSGDVIIPFFTWNRQTCCWWAELLMRTNIRNIQVPIELLFRCERIYFPLYAVHPVWNDFFFLLWITLSGTTFFFHRCICIWFSVGCPYFHVSCVYHALGDDLLVVEFFERFNSPFKHITNNYQTESNVMIRANIHTGTLYSFADAPIKTGHNTENNRIKWSDWSASKTSLSLMMALNNRFGPCPCGIKSETVFDSI